mmetsp:Transcript_48486/g.154874  ORF Transcript_48486/g.154874 Transcript_48486/m.154874 type:complete len:620 (+) Transcript_48486:3-1862(+)
MASATIQRHLQTGESRGWLQWEQYVSLGERLAFGSICSGARARLLAKADGGFGSLLRAAAPALLARRFAQRLQRGLQAPALAESEGLLWGVGPHRWGRAERLQLLHGLLLPVARCGGQAAPRLAALALLGRFLGLGAEALGSEAALGAATVMLEFDTSPQSWASRWSCDVWNPRTGFAFEPAVLTLCSIVKTADDGCGGEVRASAAELLLRLVRGMATSVAAARAAQGMEAAAVGADDERCMQQLVFHAEGCARLDAVEAAWWRAACARGRRLTVNTELVVRLAEAAARLPAIGAGAAAAQDVHQPLATPVGCPEHLAAVLARWLFERGASHMGSAQKDFAPRLLCTHGNDVRCSDGRQEPFLDMFLRCFDLSGLTLVGALRLLFAHCRPPSEAPAIDRLLQAFGEAYYASNQPSVFASIEVVYILAFSVIMLSTDQHNPRIKKRMTQEDFIRSNRGIDNGGDLPRALLCEWFDEVRRAPLWRDDPGPGQASTEQAIQSFSEDLEARRQHLRQRATTPRLERHSAANAAREPADEGLGQRPGLSAVLGPSALLAALGAAWQAAWAPALAALAVAAEAAARRPREGSWAREALGCGLEASRGLGLALPTEAFRSAVARLS